MHETNRRWKFLRPEIVILVMIPTTTLILIFSFGLLDHRKIEPDVWLSLRYVRFFGWHVFHLIGFVGLGYFAISAIAYVIQRRRFRRGASGESSPAAQRFVERFQTARNFVWITVMYLYALIANIIAMNALLYQNPEKVAWADELLMRADRMVFGTYVPFEMHTQGLFNCLAIPMLACYLQLALVLSLVLVALFIFRADRFRQFVLAFVMIVSLGLPGWAALPAITPSEAYRTVKVRSQVPIDIAYEIAGPIIHLDKGLANFLNSVERYQSEPRTGRYLITSFPSMHVALAVLTVWFGVGLWARSVVLLLPWGVLNCVGAIYSLQHYAVDAVGGIVVAIVAVRLVRGLVALEARHGIEAPKGYDLSKSIQRDVLALGRAVWRSAKRTVSRAGA